jgi:hypothetical protein
MTSLARRQADSLTAIYIYKKNAALIYSCQTIYTILYIAVKLSASAFGQAMPYTVKKKEKCGACKKN